MKIISKVDGSSLLELSCEGTIEMNPLECREFLHHMESSHISDNLLVRVGESKEWVKLGSRWGNRLFFGIHDSRIIADSDFVESQTLRKTA